MSEQRDSLLHLSERLRGDVRYDRAHIFNHRGRIGRVGFAARAWRQTLGSTLNFQCRLSLFGWQFRFEGNRTIENRKFVRTPADA